MAAKQTEKTVHMYIPYREGDPETLFYSINGRDFYINSKMAATEGIDAPECLAELIKNCNVQAIVAEDKQKELSNVKQGDL